MVQKFKMSGLTLLKYYLRIKVCQGKDVITMSQAANAEKILELTGMEDYNSCHTPSEKQDGSSTVDKTKCRNIIWCLRYLVNTLLDIAHVVGAY